jgi:CRP/FNR family transcriptional regulator, cyclic AMP receptor protein
MSGVTPADLAGHAFLRGMADGHLAVLARDCWVVPARRGHVFFAEGDPAHRFWLIGSGHVALDLHAPEGRELIVETLGQGDLLGLSWLVPPYQWQFSATAIHDTMTFEFNADAVRAACESDAGLGYQLLQRVMAAALSRLQATRVRMLDLYAASGPVRGGP